MNNTIFFFLYNFAHQSAFIDILIVFFAQFFPYIVLILAGLFLLFHHEIFQAENPYQVFLQKSKEIFPIFFSILISFIIAQFVLKPFFHTLRPFDLLSNVKALFFESGYAFPSGHSMVFMALACSLFFAHKKIGYLFMFFAFLIGITRVMAGVHFPIDILAGFVLGALVSYMVRYLYPKISSTLTF